MVTRGSQDKYPISGATVIANKTTTSDIMLPEQLGILTLWRAEHPIGGHFFFNGQPWTNILRHILDYIRILAGIRPRNRILTPPDGYQHLQRLQHARNVRGDAATARPSRLTRPRLPQQRAAVCRPIRPLRASPAVRNLHQTIVQHQIMVRKGAQRSDL